MPSVLQAISDSKTLSSLLHQMEISKTCLRIVLEHIPLGLHTSITAGSLMDGKWCLLVTNASAIAKLKQLQPVMLEAIRANNIEIESIHFKKSY